MTRLLPIALLLTALTALTPLLAQTQTQATPATSQPAAPQPAASQPAASQPATPAPEASQPAPSQPPAEPPRPPSAPASQQPTFKSGVEVVSLNVTVTDGKAFVTDLNRDDFQVYEDGVLQDLSYFSRTSTPISLSLLVDTSASMEEKLIIAQAAAIGFVRRLRPEDQAQVVDFDNRVTILQNFTSNQSDLEDAIKRTAANGSTSLYNAIYIALKELKKVRATSSEDLHRQAIVVLSDGEDTSSLVPFEEVLELAKRSEVAIYTIALRQKDAIGRGFNEADFVLKQFASETGGRAFYPQTVAELAAIYGQINEELESQYLLAYSSRNIKKDGKWRRIVVRTTRPNAVARTKQGYYGPQ